MYTIANVHPLTLVIVFASLMVTPFYALATYVASGESLRKGLAVASGFLVFGSMMSWVCLANVAQSAGQLGALIVPVCWATPTLLLFLRPGWFLNRPLSQHWLIGLQLWRVIGGLFLLEMLRGNIPGIFAYPAGIGDVIVSIIALSVLLRCRRVAIPRGAIVLVIIAGVIDFTSAFFFGFASAPGPQQIFFPAGTDNTMAFPTGMIPFFLVPFAIFFHALSWQSLKIRDR